jgi:ankyrin repeat protein
VQGDTPLGVAASSWQESLSQECSEFIEDALNEGMDPNIPNRFTLWTPLHWAAHYGDLNIVDMLLDKNACVALPDQRGDFPVDVAGFFCRKEIVKKLIDISLERIQVQCSPPSN